MGKLTDIQIRSAKNGDGQLFDGDGLMLKIPGAKAGNRAKRRWVLKYKLGGKRNSISLGSYPAIGLKEARALANDQRALLERGIDPANHRRALKIAQKAATANSFEIIGREWYDSKLASWAPAYARTVNSRLERFLFPHLGKRPMSEITPQELLYILRNKINTNDNAHRARGLCDQIFKYAIASGRAERNIAIIWIH